VVSANQDTVTPPAVFNTLIPVLQRVKSLEKITIRDMTIETDIHYGAPVIPPDALIQELVFENVKVSFAHQFALNGQTDPFDFWVDWRPLPRLCERASVVRVKSRLADRILERKERENVYKG
jgi:hypothetical protein